MGFSAVVIVVIMVDCVPRQTGRRIRCKDPVIDELDYDYVPLIPVIVDAESFAVVCSGKFAVAVVMAAFGHLSVVAVVSLCNFDFRL